MLSSSESWHEGCNEMLFSGYIVHLEHSTICRWFCLSLNSLYQAKWFSEWIINVQLSHVMYAPYLQLGNFYRYWLDNFLNRIKMISTDTGILLLTAFCPVLLNSREILTFKLNRNSLNKNIKMWLLCQCCSWLLMLWEQSSVTGWWCTIREISWYLIIDCILLTFRPATGQRGEECHYPDTGPYIPSLVLTMGNIIISSHNFLPTSS